MDGEVWHLVEGRRDDGAPAIFRIRELAPRLELPRIFVVEMPYPITEMSHLPNAAAYRRLAIFEEQWVVPACAVTGYELVGLKIEEGSFFLYMYGASDPKEVIARLSPFDGALGFYDDQDPSWGEYATLKDLLDQAKAMPAEEPAEPEPPPPVRSRAATITGIPPGPKPAATTAELKKPEATPKPAASKRAKQAGAERGAKQPNSRPAVKQPQKKAAAKQPKKSATTKAAGKNSKAAANTTAKTRPAAAKKAAAKTRTAKSMSKTAAAKRSSSTRGKKRR